MKHTAVHNLVTTALCIALGLVLPQAFHMIPQGGQILLPMHIPVLLCGLVCGWQYGLACGMMTPLLSSLITGMPMAPMLPGMVCELGAYGLVAGLLAQHLRFKRPVIGIYIQLLVAMLIGRVVYGVMNALVFQAGNYNFSLFFTAAFVTALPGIVIHLIILPPMVLLLQRVRNRYESPSSL